MASRFLVRLRSLVDRLEDQTQAFTAASELMARAIAGDGLVHLFGSGHSAIPVMDAFPRYGSFVGLNPLTDPRLLWWNVLGPGGVRELLWLERTPGYVEQFLAHRPISQGDVLVVFSHGGRNAAPVEAARYARRLGASVVAVTSLASAQGQARSAEGLAELADVIIDTGVPVEDALVGLDGWGPPIGGSSTIVACACVGELLVRTASRLMERGITLPTFVSPTVPGASLESNDAVFEAHRERLLGAARRQRSGFGAM
jgi:uncharacterized phosphosugar-binding protein